MTMNFDPPLKDCPFCGGVADYYREGGDYVPRWRVACLWVRCIAHKLFKDFSSKRLAARAWNRRVRL